MFGSSPGILGRTVKLLGGIRCTIIGVMPSGFDFPMHTQLWTTAELFNEGLQERTAHNFQVAGKLKPGIPISIAQRDISAIARRIKIQFPGTYQASDAQVISLRDRLAGTFKGSLFTLLAAVGFVLLIVCVNVANLLLARGAARAHELAIRGALGACRARLIRQLVVESLALAIAGGVAGITLAWWTLHIFKSFVPVNIPRIETVNIDSHVLAFAALISILSALLFGIVPAFAAAGIDVNETLKRTPTQHTATRGTRRIGSLLVISEIALAFMLLVGTGLLVRSFERLRHQPAGFEPANVLTAALSFPVLSLNWNAPPDRLENYQSIADRIRLIPGVRAVAYSSALPLTGDPHDGHFSVEGVPDLPGFLSDAKYRVISPGYFRAIGTRLRAGRFFSANDGPNSMPVVIINSTMARNVFPNSQALGRRIWFDSFDPERRYMTIVGIVDNIHEDGLNRPAQATGYVCYTQHQHRLVDTNLVVNVASDPMRFAPAIRGIVRSVNKDVPVAFDTLSDIHARSIARQRFETQMLGLFACIAILLAGIGIYGVLSYLVQQTRSEIGIRMALGASSRIILSGIVSRGLRVAVFGMILGFPGILVIATMLSSMLYNVSVFDPFTYFSAAVLLLVIVLFASYLPAKRATRIEPLTSL
jgi:predicted permease